MSIRFALVLVAGLSLAACSSSTPAAPTTTQASTPAPTPTPTPAPTVTNISMVNGAFGKTSDAFAPSPVTVAVGSTVMFTNNDVARHDAQADNGGFSTPVIAPGGTSNVTMSKAGSFVYHCSIHPGMVGTIVVQ